MSSTVGAANAGGDDFVDWHVDIPIGAAMPACAPLSPMNSQLQSWQTIATIIRQLGT